MILTDTAEDYLEQIYLLSLRMGVVKTSDVARALGVRVPSVIAALKLLKNRGLVHYERYGAVTLSERGLERAVDVFERHKAVFRLLRFIFDLEEGIASRDACGMEHSVSPETLAAMKDFFAFLDWKKREGHDIQEELRQFRRHQAAGDHEGPAAEDTLRGEQPLSSARDNVTYVVTRLEADRIIRRKLLDMGVIPDEPVTIRNRGPLGFPLEIMIQGYVLTLRKDEAGVVIVKEA